MISAARNIRDNAEALVKMPVKHVYDALRNPRPNVAAMLGQIRVARTLDPSRYPELKSRLPYFVCAIFSPPYRRGANFAYTEYFIIDIDHVSGQGLTIQSLRQRIVADSRTLLCFVSPGGDGLKVLMRLSAKCYDPGLYKAFYQAFAAKFARQYGIIQAVDTKTCDVTRACFMSADPDAYYNPEAEAVDIGDYIDPEADIRKAAEARHQAAETPATGTSDASGTAPDAKAGNNPSEPPDDVIAAIKRRLDIGRKAMPQKPAAYVPDELNRIIDDLRAYIESFDITVSGVDNIQYGKKIRVNIATRKAETNLFYGRRGYTVIQSPRTGTDAEANKLAADIIRRYLDEHCL